MPRGYPDFFGFSVFAFYGAIRHSGFIAIPTPGVVETVLFTITGKGRIWGGWWNVFHATNLAAQTVRIYLDGVLVCSVATTAPMVYGYDKAPGNMLYGTYYRAVDNPVAHGLFVPDQTFGQTWEFRIFNFDAAAGTGGCNIAYTLYR